MRVALREALDGDLPALFEHERDPEAARLAAFTSRDPGDRAAFDAHWARIRADPRVTIRAVVVDGEVAGSVASYDRDGRREVTYWIGRPWWGRGVATAALRAFLDVERTRPVWGSAAADNAASLRVLAKCGFVEVGRARAFARARGREVDEVVTRLG